MNFYYSCTLNFSSLTKRVLKNLILIFKKMCFKLIKYDMNLIFWYYDIWIYIYKYFYKKRINKNSSVYEKLSIIMFKVAQMPCVCKRNKNWMQRQCRKQCKKGDRQIHRKLLVSAQLNPINCNIPYMATSGFYTFRYFSLSQPLNYFLLKTIFSLSLIHRKFSVNNSSPFDIK